MSVREGWYEDPQDPARLRWWDGAAWTTHTADPPDGPGADATLADEQHVGSSAGTTPPTPPAAPSRASGPPVAAPTGPSRSSSAGLLVVLGVAAAIAVIIGIGTVGTSTGGSSQTVTVEEPTEDEVTGQDRVADTTLRLDETTTGSVGPEGSWTIELVVDASAEVRVDVRGDAGFDPVAALSDGSRELARNDDRGGDGVDRVGGEQLDPLLELRLDAGTYQLQVTGFGSSSGRFVVFAQEVR